jgi:hypothetical protein
VADKPTIDAAPDSLVLRERLSARRSKQIAAFKQFQQRSEYQGALMDVEARQRKFVENALWHRRRTAAMQNDPMPSAAELRGEATILRRWACRVGGDFAAGEALNRVAARLEAQANALLASSPPREPPAAMPTEAPSSPATGPAVEGVTPMSVEEIARHVARCIIGPRNQLPSECEYTLDELRDISWRRASKADQNSALWAAKTIVREMGLADHARLVEECRRLERERDSWEQQFHGASNAASEYVEFWEHHRNNFDAAGNYIPHSQIDGDLREAQALLASKDAEITNLDAEIGDLKGEARQAQHDAAMAQARNSELEADSDDLRRRLGEAVGLTNKLQAAITWVEHPFVEETTSEQEIRTRIGFLLSDRDQALRTAAALLEREKKRREGDGEGRADG